MERRNVVVVVVQGLSKRWSRLDDDVERLPAKDGW
jgi:hypothetical protein